jgi:itaconate CoA-transferase
MRQLNDATDPGALAGFRAVALEQAVAAPFATRQLADLGADVIKVERPGSGDFARDYDKVVNGLSSAFLWLNRGKRSISLDFKSASGRAVLDDLIETADVFVYNVSPTAAERAGFTSKSYRDRFPRTVFCGISGYGAGGPLRDAKAYDLLVQGEAGMLSVTGTGDHMAKVGVSIADISAGVYAFSGVLAALLYRERTGIARPVEVSMFDALTEWLAYPLYYTRYANSAPPRMGVSHPTIAPYGAYPTEDGVSVLLAVQNSREWERFCRIVLDDPTLAAEPSFATNPERVRHREELDARIGEALSRLPAHAAEELLDDAGIAHARVNQLPDIIDHPQISSRARWVDTETPFGIAQTLRPPTLPAGDLRDLGGVPSVGQHTEEILSELGYRPSDISRFRRDGTI